MKGQFVKYSKILEGNWRNIGRTCLETTVVQFYSSADTDYNSIDGKTKRESLASLAGEIQYVICKSSVLI